MARKQRHRIRKAKPIDHPNVRVLSKREAVYFFNRHCWQRYGISGTEFLHRYRAADHDSEVNGKRIFQTQMILTWLGVKR